MPLDPFLMRALAAGIGVAIVAAPMGCFIVWRRMAYFGATIAHSGLLGVALGFLLGVDPALGVLITALFVAVLLILLQRQTFVPDDTILGILAHAALAAGFIAAAGLGGRRIDLMGFLFGDILSVSPTDLAWIYGGGAVVLGLLIGGWRSFLAISVHEELAAAEGLHTRLMPVLFMLLIAFTIALAMKIVGILLITALLIIPAAAARPLSRNPEQMAVIAAGVAVLAVAAGLALSLRWDWPAGPAIVIALTGLFAGSLLAYSRPNWR